jgi:hypothetical protein
MLEITPMNRRSPRVVSMGRNPFLATLGEYRSHMPRHRMVRKSPPKKMMLGDVQYIQDRKSGTPSTIVYTLPKAKPFAI